MYTGFFKAKILAINPNVEEINELLGECFTEKIEYVYTDKYNNQCCNIDIYLKDNQENVFKHTIVLKNKFAKTKNGANIYVNCIGDSQIAQNDDQLWSSFKYFERILTWKKDEVEQDDYFLGAKPGKVETLAEKKYKNAFIGEDELMLFLKHATNINTKNISSNLFVDIDLIFQEDFTSLQIEEKDFHLTCFAYELDGVQKIHKYFFPLDFYRDVLNNMTISSKYKKYYNDFLQNLNYTEGEWEIGKIQKFKSEFVRNKKDFTDQDSDY